MFYGLIMDQKEVIIESCKIVASVRVTMSVYNTVTNRTILLINYQVLISDNPLVRARWSWGSPSESVSVAITERACERLHRSKSNLRMLILLVESWRRVQKYSCITIIMNVFILNSKLTVDKSVNKQLTVSVIWLYWIYFNMDDFFNRLVLRFDFKIYFRGVLYQHGNRSVSFCYWGQVETWHFYTWHLHFLHFFLLLFGSTRRPNVLQSTGLVSPIFITVSVLQGFHFQTGKQYSVLKSAPKKWFEELKHQEFRSILENSKYPRVHNGFLALHTILLMCTVHLL